MSTMSTSQKRGDKDGLDFLDACLEASRARTVAQQRTLEEERKLAAERKQRQQMEPRATITAVKSYYAIPKYMRDARKDGEELLRRVKQSTRQLRNIMGTYESGSDGDGDGDSDSDSETNMPTSTKRKFASYNDSMNTSTTSESGDDEPDDEEDENSGQAGTSPSANIKPSSSSSNMGTDVAAGACAASASAAGAMNVSPTLSQFPPRAGEVPQTCLITRKQLHFMAGGKGGENPLRVASEHRKVVNEPPRTNLAINHAEKLGPSNQEQNELVQQGQNKEDQTPPAFNYIAIKQENIKQEDSDDTDDIMMPRSCYFRLVISSKVTNTFIRLTCRQDHLTFKGLREEIEECIDLPFGSFQFTDGEGDDLMVVQPKQEKKLRVFDNDFDLTSKGDGSRKKPYRVFIQEAK